MSWLPNVGTCEKLFQMITERVRSLQLEKNTRMVQGYTLEHYETVCELEDASLYMALGTTGGLVCIFYGDDVGQARRLEFDMTTQRAVIPVPPSIQIFVESFLATVKLYINLGILKCKYI